MTSATLELQEAALTGESAPVAKDGTSVLDAETVLGDRTNLVFQNTQVTRGTAAVVVTATGSATEMGRIADMVTATQRQRSPLQKELDGMTKVFGLVAWLAVAVIAIFGIARGQSFDTVVLLCISTAIASIPVGLPTFVQAMLSSGAQRLAESKAVVKSLADVETLGGTTVINSDKTGTLTLNQMTATTMLAGGDWFRVEGGGYRKSGTILGVAGSELPDFRRLALGLTLCSDATVADDESIIGDPTEAALVVLAAKMSADAEQTRNSLERRAEVPFDSEYKFMATFHDRPDWLAGGILKERHFMTVKGAPDVVLGLCSHALWHGQEIPIDEVRKEILDANQQLSEKGPQIIRWVLSGLVVAVTALLVLDLGPDKRSTTHASVSMTMAFAFVAFTAVNLGFVMRREREAPWSSPLFPYMGWIILGWFLTWAGVELHMFQRLLDTESLTGSQWAIVLGLSLIAPALVWADKAIQLRRQQKPAA